MIKKLIVLIGPPGSGKGTFGQWLQNKYRYHHFSTGSILQYALTDQKLKKQLEPIWASGRLVEDHLMSDIIFHTIQTQNSSSTVILDGFPRNFAQHKLLIEQVTKLKIKTLQIIIFDLDLKLCQMRIQNRLICPTCQQIYHQTFRRPRIDNLCDQDQTKLVKRIDESKIMTRFSVFRQQTLPLIEWYKNPLNQKSFQIVVLNADQKIPAIQSDYQKIHNSEDQND